MITASTIFAGGAALYFMISGIMMLVTGKLPGNSQQKYTEESIRKFSVPGGICSILMGISTIPIILPSFNITFGMEPSKLRLIGIVPLLILLIVYVILFKTMTKKK